MHIAIDIRRGSRKIAETILRKDTALSRYISFVVASSRDRAIFDCDGICRGSRKNITPLVISLAPLAQISIYVNIIFFVLFRSCFTHEYRLPLGKYRAALRHITCAEGANIDLRKYPLIHRRRDGGPPSPQSSAKPSGRRSVRVRKPTNDGQPFAQGLPINGMRAKVGMCGESRRGATIIILHKDFS